MKKNYLCKFFLIISAGKCSNPGSAERDRIGIRKTVFEIACYLTRNFRNTFQNNFKPKDRQFRKRFCVFEHLLVKFKNFAYIIFIYDFLKQIEKSVTVGKTFFVRPTLANLFFKANYFINFIINLP